MRMYCTGSMGGICEGHKRVLCEMDNNINERERQRGDAHVVRICFNRRVT